MRGALLFLNRPDTETGYAGFITRQRLASRRQIYPLTDQQIHCLLAQAGRAAIVFDG
jgi:hypothetical protein